MRFTVGGAAEHYTTVGGNAAFLLLLVHVLPFTVMLGSTLGFFSSSLHMFGQLLPVTELLLHSSRRYSAPQLLIVQWRSAYLMRHLWGQTVFLFDCGRTHLFYSWCWYYTTHLGAFDIADTC